MMLTMKEHHFYHKQQNFLHRGSGIQSRTRTYGIGTVQVQKQSLSSKISFPCAMTLRTIILSLYLNALLKWPSITFRLKVSIRLHVCWDSPKTGFHQAAVQEAVQADLHPGQERADPGPGHVEFPRSWCGYGKEQRISPCSACQGFS